MDFRIRVLFTSFNQIQPFFLNVAPFFQLSSGANENPFVSAVETLNHLHLKEAANRRHFDGTKV